MDEEWRPVPGYEDRYEVSNHRRVRSKDQILNRKNGTVKWPGRTLKPQKGSKGHYGVNLCRDGTSKTYFIHRLVAESFLDNPENYPLVRHLDDVKENNGVENLAWGTYSDNAYDAIRNGRDFNTQRDKTHCPRGHPYSGENLYISPSGARSCKTCKSESQKSDDAVKQRKSRRIKGLPAGDSRHGSLNGYSNYGCRCESCVTIKTKYELGRRK